MGIKIRLLSKNRENNDKNSSFAGKMIKFFTKIIWKIIEKVIVYVIIIMIIIIIMYYYNRNLFSLLFGV